MPLKVLMTRAGGSVFGLGQAFLYFDQHIIHIEMGYPQWLSDANG